MSSERKRVQYEQRKAAGRCVACNEPTTYGVRCFRCAMKHTERVKRYLARRAA